MPIIIVIVLILVGLYACGSSTADECGSESLAGIMAENFVKRELRDPDSAKFTQTNAERADDYDCSYVVQGRFSARNGFGGMTPGVFAVEMRKERGENSWRAIDLIVQ